MVVLLFGMKMAIKKKEVHINLVSLKDILGINLINMENMNDGGRMGKECKVKNSQRITL